jgi:multicomponent K+:H+ antiporter subunit A
VEVVTLVLMLLGLRWLPKRSEIDDPRRRMPRARLRRARDVALSVLAGAGLASLAYAIMVMPRGEGIARFFMEHALPDSGGRNVVNVILVDFRGMDTMGEITVVGVVALAVYKLLRRFRPAAESIPIPHGQSGEVGDAGRADPAEPLPHGVMRVPAVLAQLLLPVAGVVSVLFLLRGHNAPGGGFVGGLVMATGFIVQYMMSGTLWIELRTRVHPQYAIGLGLLCAGAAGCGAWLASRNFLTNISWHGNVPLLGEVFLSSTLLFDLGVYLLVVGSTTLILVALAHQSLRSHRQQVEAGTTRVLPAEQA